MATVAFGFCSTVKEGNQNHSFLFPWEPGGISAHVKIGSYKEYAADAIVHANQETICPQNFRSK
jgi:hypothetical protein